MTGPFDIPEGMPRIERAIVDEETQMMRYLAEMAMEDIALLPDPKARRVRPGSLLAQYHEMVADRHSAESAGLLDGWIEETMVSDDPVTGVSLVRHAVGEFIGKPKGE